MYRYSLKDIHYILQNINDGVFILDHNDNLLYINNAGEKYFGKKRHELLNKNIWSIYDVPRESPIYKKIKFATKEKVVTRIYEYSSALKKWVEGTVYPNENDAIIIFRDVTDIVNNQNKLIEDHRNFSEIINSNSDAMWLLDRTYKIIVANYAFYSIAEKVWGHSITDRINLMDYDQVEKEKWSALYEKAFNGESSDFYDEVEVNGKMKYYRHIIDPVYKDGKIIAINCQSRDTTERILRMRKIEDQNKLLSEIAYNQSHNIRRPIATILGLIALINPAVPEDPENTEILKSLKLMAHEIDSVIKACVQQINDIEGFEHYEG